MIIFQEALKQQKLRRENQVTLYRKYRSGDLPDIQINYSYVIAPLQALAHVSNIQISDSKHSCIYIFWIDLAYTYIIFFIWCHLIARLIKGLSLVAYFHTLMYNLYEFVA